MAVSPDGDFVYVSNAESDDLSVIDTGSNTVIATVPVGYFPVTPWAFTVPQKPPEPGEFVPFESFDVRKLYIHFKNNGDDFHMDGRFTLGEFSDGIDPLGEEVLLDVGTFSVAIPAGSFTMGRRSFCGKPVPLFCQFSRLI